MGIRFVDTHALRSTFDRLTESYGGFGRLGKEWVCLTCLPVSVKLEHGDDDARWEVLLG